MVYPECNCLIRIIICNNAPNLYYNDIIIIIIVISQYGGNTEKKRPTGTIVMDERLFAARIIG